MKLRALPLSMLFLLLASGNSKLFAQQSANITEKLTSYVTKHTSEKVYLQFDKPYYAAGDTIYFKAYVTMGERHNLSQLSGVLHAELINTANKIDKTIRLQIVNGVTWGDFALPDSLPTGNYTVRAYTRWMQNDGPDAFFEKVIPVGNLHPQGVSESTTAKQLHAKADMQFFPEGGELVAGVNSKIAFKAVGTNGLGIGVTGSITDNTGKQIAAFSSTHLGMGYFNLLPEYSRTYTAHIIYGDGSKDNIQLPHAKTVGICMRINNDSIQHAPIKIIANKEYFEANKGKEYTVLIWSGGYASTVNCKLDSPMITMDLIKRRLFTGVARITLFSPDAEPLCERLIFIQKFDQLNLNIDPEKTAYKIRDKVTLKLNARTTADSSAAGHFSVSVTDESKVPVDENSETTILTDLLLTSNLKGNIEQPNYYFTNVTDEKLKELDLVMLTHGYRHFIWKTVIDSASNPVKYQAETGLSINGKVTNLFGKPISKAAVALIPVEYKGLLSDTTDNNGEFSFSNLLFTDSAKFVLQAVNKKGKNTTRLILDKDEPSFAAGSMQVLPPFSANPTMDTYLANARKEQEAALKYGFGKTRLLKEVKITARKSAPLIMTQYGVADQVVSGDKILYGGSLSVRLAGLVHFHQHFKKPIKVVWNGIEMPRNFNIDEINTGSIESIQVITDSFGIDYDNVLIINTTFGIQVKDMIAMGILPITVQGYYKAREFYSPKYEATLATTTRPDLRSTIYWNPAVVTDKNGNASFNFYNADTPGNYRVVIEGIDNEGNVGRKVVELRID